MSSPKIPGGCLLLARKIIDSNIWAKPPLYIKVWIYFLARAQHKPFKGQKRGQFWVTIPEIIEAVKWKVGCRTEKPTKDQIFQIIEWLRKPDNQDSSTGSTKTLWEGHESNTKATMIATTRATRGLLVTVENYDFYQTLSNYESNDEPDNEKSMGGSRKQRQPDTINKNGKNVNNEQENILDFGVPLEPIKSPHEIIFDYWNSKNITVHKAISKPISTATVKALKQNTPEEICTAIERYHRAWTDQSYYYSYKWTLDKFLTQYNGYVDWLDEGQRWVECQQHLEKGKKQCGKKDGLGFSYPDDPPEGE